MTDPARRARLLGLQIGAVLLALVGAVGLLALVLYETNEHDEAERVLREAAQTLTPADAEPGFWVVEIAPTHRRATGGLPEGLPLEDDVDRVREDGRARQREVELSSGTFFVRTLRRDSSVVQVVMDRTAAERAGDQVLSALLVAGGLGVLLAAAAAALLARRAFQPVAEALAMQRRFVSDAGHELRTPLTLLSTRAQLLARRLARERAPEPELLRDAEGLVTDASALTALLEELLVAAEPGASQPRETADVAGLVRACVEAARGAASERQLTVRLGGADRAEAPVSEPAVRRAVTSLLDNALEHARTEVLVEVAVERRQVAVRVSDDGPGVPREVADRLFARFASHRPAQPVTGRRHYGLGLALVAEVAAAHGGAVAAEGRPGGGTTFTLTLRR